MSDDPLTELQAYTDRFQATAVQNRLAAAGIRAIVTGTDAASAFGMGGAPASRSVRIEVAQSDLHRARQILEQDQQRAAESVPWVCTECGEPNEATFDVCWRCNSPKSPEGEQQSPELPATDPVPITVESSAAPPIAYDGNPYQPVRLGAEIPRGAASSGDEVANAELRADVRRAFLASIVGWLVFPPLVNCYSVYRLLRLPRQIPHERSLRIEITAAWFINLAALILWPLVWMRMIWAN